MLFSFRVFSWLTDKSSPAAMGSLSSALKFYKEMGVQVYYQDNLTNRTSSIQRVQSMIQTVLGFSHVNFSASPLSIWKEPEGSFTLPSWKA